MKNVRGWLGALFVTIPFAFAACGDDEDDDGGGDGSSTGARGGSTGGSVTGGRGGSSGQGGATGGRMTGGRGGTPTGGSAGEGGSAGDDGGMGGDDGGMGGEAGEPQGGAAGGGMGGTGGAGTGGSVAGGGVGGAGSGGLAGGGVGGAGAGGLAGGGMAGAGGVAPTCDPNPAPQWFAGEFSGAQEVPPVTSSGTGFAVAELNSAETQLTVSFYWSGLGSNTTAAHVHGPGAVGVGADIVFPLTVPTPTGLSGEVVGATFAITSTQVAQLKQSLYYGNIHSVNNSGGEIRAQLVPVTTFRSGTLSGAQEVPPVASSGTGRAVVGVFPSGMHAAVSLSWSGLNANTSVWHIHGPAAFGVGPVGVLWPMPNPTVEAERSGSVTHRIWTFSGSHSANLLGNLAYANVHSTAHTGGELRAQLLPPCP